MPDDQAATLRALREALARRPFVPVPKISETPPKSAANDAASREAEAFASGDLEAESAKREHKRTERFRDHVAFGIIIVFWMGFVALVLAALAWAVNFALPPEKAFLTNAQSETIVSFLTGGGLTGFLSNYAKKRLE